MFFEYYKPGYPEDLKTVLRKADRAVHRAKMLENAVNSAAPEDFDALMDQLEEAQDEEITAFYDFFTARCKWLSQNPLILPKEPYTAAP